MDEGEEVDDLSQPYVEPHQDELYQADNVNGEEKDPVESPLPPAEVHRNTDANQDSAPDEEADPVAGVVENENMRRLETHVIIVCLIGFVVNQLVTVNSPYRVTREAPTPGPLLANTTYLDLYQGDLGTLYEVYLRHEVTVTLYYAPWDATSRDTLIVLDKLANIFPDVKFVAINCWQNPGCYKYYQFKFYPSMTAYVRGAGTVQYPIYSSLSVDYIATFLYNVINPVRVVNNQMEWYLIRSRHMALVTVPKMYFRFGYSLALESLRKDPRQRVGFTIVRDKSDSIRLHLWNETLTYEEAANPTVSTVSKWVYSNFKEPTGYLMNSGYKSSQIFKLLNTTQAFLIVKMAPNSTYNVNLNMLAMQFYACPDTYENHTQQVLLSLMLGMDSRPLQCAILPEVVVCTSTSATCRMKANLSYQIGWWARVTEVCEVSEVESQRREEISRLCSTHRVRDDVDKSKPKGLLWGLGCGREDTFRIVTLDSVLYERLFPLEAPAVIYDVSQEIKYLLPGDKYSPRGLEYFIARYLANIRTNLIKSTSVVRQDIFREQISTFVGPSMNTKSSHHKNHGESVIFESSIQDTVIFFYTNWCGFCKSVAANFHRVSRFFTKASTSIAFMAVDAEGSRFPNVIYSQSSYPSLLFFPRNSTDSVRYNGTWKPQCLTRFILHYCSEEVIALL